MIQRLAPLFGTGFLAIVLASMIVWASDSIAERDVIITETEPRPPVEPTASEQPTILASTRPAVYYQAITDRPLFSPTRRPETTEPLDVPTNTKPLAAPDEAVPVPDFQLKGTMVMGGQASALLSVDSAAPVWFEFGTDIAGWTLTQIGPDWAELSNNSDILRVELYPK